MVTAEPLSIVVQKFGGTSVANPSLRQAAIGHVEEALRGGKRVVVVVSAMGRQGDPYATDTLLGLLPEVPSGLEREIDLLLACGEIISGVVFAAQLRAAGHAATVMTGGQAGIITDRHYQDARILRVDGGAVRQELEQGQVVVVAGFQGRTEEGQVTTLGRGGSDTTAAALGAALGAEVVEIYTDVDGMKTADPRVVPEARTLAQVDYQESFQMAQQGARVIHPRAVEIANQFNLPLRIRGTEGDDPGTLISHGSILDRWQHRQSDRVVAGVTARVPVVQVLVETERPDMQLTCSLFRGLADAGISVDLISLFPHLKSFTIEPAFTTQAREVLHSLGVPYRLEMERAKVSIVGSAIHGLPGVLAVVVETLDRAGVEILATSDSHLSISCLVPESQAALAVRALHRAFHLDEGLNSE